MGRTLRVRRPAAAADGLPAPVAAHAGDPPPRQPVRSTAGRRTRSVRPTLAAGNEPLDPGFSVPRLPLLLTAARWLLGLLAVRVLASVLANYPSYFPPDFGSLFLEGREGRFWGWYAVAFYVHILTAPWALLAGLVLLSGRVRRRWPAWHRWLGRVQVVLILAAVAPSAAAMAVRSYAGPAAGASFLLLSVATAYCAARGWQEAVRRRFAAHRRWMVRCAVLLGSAVTLRLVSGAASLAGVSDPEAAYVLAAWASWLVPLAACKLLQPADSADSARPRRPGRL